MRKAVTRGISTMQQFARQNTMPSKKQLNNRGRASLILRARAGLIPASDAIEDELNARITEIGRTVRAYARLEHGRNGLAVTEILHDLRHYCDSKALVFDELDAAAHEHYLEDSAESPWISRPRRADDQGSAQTRPVNDRG